MKKIPQVPEQPSPLPNRKHERMLRALADTHRLEILSLLKQHGDTLCVEQIVERFSLKQSTVSHHLSILRTAELVDCREAGRKVFYFIDAEKLTEAYMAIRDLVPGVRTGKKSA